MKSKIKFIISCLCVILLSACTSKDKKVFTEADITIIPKPAKQSLAAGSFEFNATTKIVLPLGVDKEVVTPLILKFKNAASWEFIVTDNKADNNVLSLVVDPNLPKEGYKLMVNDTSITIVASDNGGFLYGIQSLLQLLPTAIESKELVTENVRWLVPNVTIEDQPRYEWRGLMLDLSRHFFDKEYIKKTIDGLAMHKMNVLHLHLVDDQGWRIEIKKYPKLTEVGAWRVDQEDAHWNARKNNSPEEKGTFGGFLSQEDLKEIVAYATANNVEVIPEIEMPAHVTSAIAAYPYLSCHGESVGVPSGGLWPITDIYCAGKESSFEFLEDVLAEVMEIFPSKYIHIGGDEATKTNWGKCNHCKKRMQTEGLHDVEELQSYFVKRMEKFINNHGKKLVGWDEIIEGGLAPDATVMSWRGAEPGFKASAQGHDVVMTPGTHCYFDHYQGPQDIEPAAWGGYSPLSKVYQFDPIIDSMTVKQKSHILGGQANLWAEFVTTDQHSQYMIYPRIAALAEAVWSPKELRNWEDFSSRIINTFERYEYKGINYAKSAFLVTANIEGNIEDKSVRMTLQNEFPNTDIRYVLGDIPLDDKAIKYTTPITLKETTVVKAALYKNDTVVGRFFTDTIQFHKAVAHKVSYKIPYSDSYQGVGAFNMVNTLRGTKNFHDGQWQAWLGKDMQLVIDLEKEEEIAKVTVGALENQGPGIYFPTAVIVEVSTDGTNYKKVGKITRAYAKRGDSELKDFVVDFSAVKATHVRVTAKSLKETPEGGGVWLFVDEILID